MFAHAQRNPNTGQLKPIICPSASLPIVGLPYVSKVRVTLLWGFIPAQAGTLGQPEGDHGDGAHLSGRPAKGMRPQGAGPQGRASDGERVHLARILWHLLKYKQPFNPEVFAQEEAKMKRKKLARLHNLAESLNYRLVQIQ